MTPSMYRMPLSFGPSIGPRQGPEGREWECRDGPLRTTLSSQFRTEEGAIRHLLPSPYSLDGLDPVVTMEVTRQSRVEWLAGRGYNILGVTVPARFTGPNESITGRFLLIAWESLADPVITGREELGYAKIWGEVSDLHPNHDWSAVTASASWLGHEFAVASFTDLQAVEEAPPTPQPRLHMKYIPRTGAWGEADVRYPTMTPESVPNARLTRHMVGRGTVSFLESSWEQLPTFHGIVNQLAALPIVEQLPARLVETQGFKMLRDQRILSEYPP